MPADRWPVQLNEGIGALLFEDPAHRSIPTPFPTAAIKQSAPLDPTTVDVAWNSQAAEPQFQPLLDFESNLLLASVPAAHDSSPVAVPLPPGVVGFCAIVVGALARRLSRSISFRR